MITAYIIGDREVIARFAAMGEKAQQSLSRAVMQLGLELDRRVKQKLSGEVLKVRTGVLRSSTNLSVSQTPTSVLATEGTNVRYARVHEFGFQGTVSVRAHLRHVVQVFGRPIAATQNVRAHTRRMNLPERSFLRSALREMEPQIRTGMEAAVREGLRG